MSISERISKLRSILNLKQLEFATPLGVDRSYIAALEKGTRSPSESLIKLISYEYGVSVTWLKSGEGEMFISPVETVKNQIARFGEQALQKALYEIFSKPVQMILESEAQYPERNKEKHFDRGFISTYVGSGKTESFLSNFFAVDPELRRMIEILQILWESGDDRLKAWASIQFDRAFPTDVVEEAQKKNKKKPTKHPLLVLS